MRNNRSASTLPGKPHDGICDTSRWLCVAGKPVRWPSSANPSGYFGKHKEPVINQTISLEELLPIQQSPSYKHGFPLRAFRSDPNKPSAFSQSETAFHRYHPINMESLYNWGKNRSAISDCIVTFFFFLERSES